MAASFATTSFAPTSFAATSFAMDELTMVLISAVENGQGVFLFSAPLAGAPTSLIAIPQGKTVAEGAAQSNLSLAGDNVTLTFDTNRGANPNVVRLNDPLTTWIAQLP